MNPKEIIMVSSGGGRLHVRFTADIKMTDMHRLYGEIRKQAVAEEATELLIDASAYQKKLGVLGRLQMILAFVANLRGFRVAGVISEANIDPNRLGETMARNRGANVKVFTTLPEAVAWLGWDKTK
jgi:hypothetical protein